MKLHSFGHEGWATGSFFMGSDQNSVTPREELLVLGAEQGCGLGVAIRLQRADGTWANFGRVAGFELTVMGTCECMSMIQLLKELIKEVEAQERDEQVERKIAALPKTAEEAAELNLLFMYDGHEDVNPKDFVYRVDHEDFFLPDSDEE